MADINQEEFKEVDFVNQEDGSGIDGRFFTAARQGDALGNGQEYFVGNIEQKTNDSYEKYFGPEWRILFRDYLLADVRVANPSDRARVGRQVGFTETAAEATNADNRIVKNHIVSHISPEWAVMDWALRTEVGEALYNLLENAAVTGKIPHGENGMPQGFRKMDGTDSETAVFAKDLLDRWATVYDVKPQNRYTGLTGAAREYGNIPEWKSEGFSDGIACAIRQKSGLEMKEKEAETWASFSPDAQQVINLSVEQFLPPIARRVP